MVIVMPCAGDKCKSAGRMKQADGKLVEFVAHPKKVPPNKKSPTNAFAHPDCLISSSSDKSWRDELKRYNVEYRRSGSNPLKLLPAKDLYRPRAHSGIYQDLVAKFSLESVFILSAGWGLIGSGFLTPYYDVTFNSGAREWKKRKTRDDFDDLCHLKHGMTGPLVFLGGNDYLKHFARLTQGIECQKVVFFYNDTNLSAKKTHPSLPNTEFRPFDTTECFKRIWHYLCAQALIDGRVTI